MMAADVDVRCDAGYGEVNPDRVNSRNGYRRRTQPQRSPAADGANRRLPG